MHNYLDDYKNAYQDSFAYSLDNRLMLNWYSDRILKLAKGKSLLELGIGHGYSSIKFSKAFEKYLVLDGSAEVIAVFRQKNAGCKINVIHTYFEEFDSAEKFDVIVMGFILEHVENPAFILNHYKKFLNPGGSIFITVPNAEALNKRIGHEAGILTDIFKLTPADLELGHRRLFSVETLKTLIQSQGYETKIIEGIFLKPITTQQLLALHLSEDILQAMLRVGINYPELCVGILMELVVA